VVSIPFRNALTVFGSIIVFIIVTQIYRETMVRSYSTSKQSEISGAQLPSLVCANAASSSSTSYKYESWA
jgi:hypothetical protein